MWVLLFKCLANRTLPLHNISYRLFLDDVTVTWFSSKNTCTMRYSDIVKRFWRTGCELFKAKFLRFMSEMKDKCQSLAHESLPGCYEPSQSSVNFIVPTRNILQLEDKTLKTSCTEPGVLWCLIEDIAKRREYPSSPYKLCIDLKKPNPWSASSDTHQVVEIQKAWINTMDHIRISGNELLSVILSQTK